MPAQSGRSVGPQPTHYRAPPAMDRRNRSAYGIHNSDDRPAGPTPWFVHFINALSERSAKVRARYQRESASGQIPGTADTYATKLESQWRSGGTRGSRADAITQRAQIPTLMAGWPQQVGSGAQSAKPASRYGMDPRNPSLVNGKSPMYLPRHEGGQIRLHSQTGQTAQDYLPTRFSVVPPMRIVRMKRYATGMMGGSAQFGTRQTWGQGPDCIVISPVNVIPGMRSRGVISARGVIAPKQGTGRERIPALFTPSSVQ